jgi:hypothetical protein
MAASGSKALSALCAALPLLAWSQTEAPPQAVAPTLQPYSAVYSIYRNGKLTGKAEVELLRQGEQYVIRSETRGTHGLARILAARDSESAALALDAGRFRPTLYLRHTRVAGIDDRWRVTFDWTARVVSVSHNRGEALQLPMSGDALDPLSLKLAVRQDLERPPQTLRYFMVEEDEIDEQHIGVLPQEWMETSLGCLLTVPVEKLRQGSTRYTRAWHAPELGHIEVRMEHGKTGGAHMEMRISELVLNGEEIVPRPGCAARQAAGAEAVQTEPVPQ